MGEGEWLTTAHFEKLYSEVKRRHGAAQSKGGRRRLRLLACGICRCLLWHLGVPEGNRRAVEAAEAFADGLIGPGGLAEARAGCRPPFPEGTPDGPRLNAASAAMRWAAEGRTASLVFQAATNALRAAGEDARAEARGAPLRAPAGHLRQPLPAARRGPCLARPRRRLG